MTVELKVHNVKTVEAETVRFQNPGQKEWYSTTITATRENGEQVNFVVYHDDPLSIPHTNRDAR